MKKIKGFSYLELFNLAINKPVLAQIEITQNCNQNCSFCFKNYSKSQKHQDQSLFSWKKVIKKLVNFGIEIINFTGGEIFLYKNFLKLVDYSKKIGVKQIIVNTNGSFYSRDFSKFRNIDSFVFSVHGLSEIHDKIVDRPGSFKLLLKNVRKAKDFGLNVGINMVIIEANLSQVMAVYNFFNKFKLNFYSFNLAGDPESIDRFPIKLFNSYFKILKEISNMAGNKTLLRHGMQNIFINDINFYKAAIPMPHCAAGKYKLLIDCRGDVFPCSFFQTYKFFCGNIFSDSLHNIWKNGKGFKIFRKIALDHKKLPPKCSTCFKRYKCLGGCLVWRVYNKKNKTYEKDIRCQSGNAYIRGGDNQSL